MNRLVLGLGASALLTASLAAAGRQPPSPPSQQSANEVIAAWGSQRFVDEQFGRTRRPEVFRLGSDYTVKAGEDSGGMFVVAGNAGVEGRTRDVGVVLGNVTIAGTADIQGSLVLIDSTTTVAPGAHLRGDLVVIGGDFTAPPDFAADGNHVVIDNQTLGGRFRGVFAWITDGLLLGGQIVPSLSWIWTAVLVLFFVYSLLNLLFEHSVGEVAGVLVERPFSAFGVGLLVLLLIGPISVLLAASVIGLAVVPLILCALLVAWVIGKVAGDRWIGGSLLPRVDGGRGRAMLAFAIGFALITIAYMVPLLGFVTWTMMGVFGVGASTLAFVQAYRRENPPALPHEFTVSPPPIHPVPSTFTEERPVSPAPSSVAFEPAVPLVTPTPAVVATLPHASFRDRVAAGVLDLVLVLLSWQILNLFRGGRTFFLVLLAYHIAFWTWKGTTIGGIICQLRVVRIDSLPLRFVDALVRGLSAIFSILVIGLGEFWILRDPERQAWHDRIAGTYVVKVPRNWPL